MKNNLLFLISTFCGWEKKLGQKDSILPLLFCMRISPRLGSNQLGFND